MRKYSVNLSNLAKYVAITSGILFLAINGLACVSQDQLNTPLSITHQTPATQDWRAQKQSPTILAGLPPLSRLASASGDFLVYQDGADFAADLAYSRCAPSGTSAALTPDYVGMRKPLSDAAFGLYRLELDPAAASATLTLAWNGAVPASADCWVGLSNWGRGGWDWQPLTSSAIELGNPAIYADAAKHCYAALVMLGNTPVELVSISFGPKPPPPGRGYTLFAPMTDTSTYLIDATGALAHTWTGQYTPGASVLLAEDGHLWRQVNINNPDFPPGGKAGRLEVVDWDSNPIWSYELSTNTQCTHHDFALLPSGNVLLIVWNKYTPAQVTAAGRNPATIGSGGLYVDSILEVEPSLPKPTIVWQWNAFDHLVQNYDSNQPYYGDPAAHPELIDFNYFALRSDDWLHTNAVAYNAALDQIVISPLCFSELWIIDHSTTTEEAAGHTGGKYGHGGDLLYRWGNQQAYGAGAPSDRKLFGQHDVQWIAPGLQGAGDLLIFNNQAGTPDGSQYSTVLEITTPLNPDGSYYMTGAAYGPDGPAWQYKANPPTQLFALNMSSAQRLPDGNTLICNGPRGYFFEVTPSGDAVWEYQNTLSGNPSVFRAVRYQPDYPGLGNLSK